MATSKHVIKEKKDILILFEEKDSKDWTQFIQECFTDCPKRLLIDVLDLNTNIDEIISQASSYWMVLVIISNEMLKTMESKASVLNPCLQKHPSVSAIKLYLEKEKFSIKFRQDFKSCDQWKEFIVGADTDVDHVQKIISEIINELEKVNTPEKHTSEKHTRNRIHYIGPDQVRQGGETMTLVLRTPVTKGQCVQVQVGAENTPLIDTKTLNTYCFTFKAPAHKAGRADVRLLIDGQKICKKSIYYSSMTRFAYTCPEFLCQLLGLNHDDKAGLDTELTNIFNNSAPQDGSLQCLLTPKNLQATSTGGTEGRGELPTLLHFACKFGLNDLAVSVMDTPGSSIAVNMDNEQGLTPLDIALETNNEELVQYLESFVEMHNYVTEIEDLYERMSGGKALDPYINLGDGKNKYLQMGRPSDVQEAYVEARVASRLSDYETTDAPPTFPGGPEEVAEEDDIPPEVPQRPHAAKKPVKDTTSSQQTYYREPPSVMDQWPAIPEDDFFAGKSELPSHSMGSTNLDELSEYGEAFKRGDFSLDDIERLYKAWHERNRDASSSSIKERKKQLDEMKDTYQSLMSVKKGGAARKKSVMFWKKKEKPIEIDIQHHVQPNKYESWTIMRGTAPPRSHRDSTVSNISNTSSSSSSSRDSALGPVTEVDSDSDNEKKENRQSWGDQFLKKVQNRPNSRLPKPPPTNPVYVRHKLPTMPEIPPRPPKPRHYTD
ncbi:phosphoinositide 3-kinase adapter protein 1-like isoform X2 [Ruditapes philippinarum]|uniref:phosphoinositide 3-kinase adapter protein 1-like isoform X2 n=1 Tax=Ruditapes philippinarum TaxID=129788 RepID=UPI00295C392B|nr:phosphoinositide 3-kinase adapter protein 1-like isoform X2 [Ruditapes philippinarum]